jgi:DNA polymerase-3 subunit delta
VPLVAAFASKLRTMARISGSTAPAGQLAQKFGLAPWQVDRARRDLHGFTDAGLARCLEVLADTDEQIKGLGRDPVFALERMIGVISSRGSAA